MLSVSRRVSTTPFPDLWGATAGKVLGAPLWLAGVHRRGVRVGTGICILVSEVMCSAAISPNVGFFFPYVALSYL